VGALVTVVKIRGIKRELRDFSYLERNDPSAYHALVNAHSPKLIRHYLWLAALPLLVGGIAALVIVDWRTHAAEAARLERAARVEPDRSAPRPGTRLWADKYMIYDGGHVVRVYYYAPPDRCVLTEVEQQELDDEVRIRAYTASTVAERYDPECALSRGNEPNRYFQVRLSEPLGKRRLLGADTEVKRRYWPWLSP
jgi:hypothetical protein